MPVIFKMKIPDKIKIGNRDFKVKIKRLINWDNNISGQIRHGDAKLILAKNLSGKRLEDTFFHEISHGLFKEMEFNYPQMVKFRNDETFIQEFGLLLRNTFLDLLKKQDATHIQNETKEVRVR